MYYKLADKWNMEMCIKHVVEARRELKAYLYSLKEQFAGIDKMKALTKEEKVNLFFI